MADFSARVLRGAVLRRWTDPPGPNGEPSRTRPHPGYDQLYWLATVGVPVQFVTTVQGSEGISDAGLSSRLFSAFMAEGFGPVNIVAVPGWTSFITWMPSNAGHHVIGISRKGGGIFLIPLDVQKAS